MNKKESAKRGYMSAEEIEQHLNKYQTESSREIYLDKVLSKQGLLAPKTREAFQNVRRGYYEKDAKAIAGEKEVPEGVGGRYHRIKQMEASIKKAGGSPQLYMEVAKILASMGESKKDPYELGEAARMAEKAGDEKSARKFYEEEARIDLVSINKDFSYRNTRELAEKAGGTPEVYGRLAEAAIRNAKENINLNKADPFRSHQSRLKRAEYLATRAESPELIEEVASMATELRYSDDAARMAEKANSLRKKMRQGRGDLTSRLSSVIAIVGVLGGIFFLSSNVTGNAIADLTTKTTSFLGAGLIIIGLVAGLFWVKKK